MTLTFHRLQEKPDLAAASVTAAIGLEPVEIAPIDPIYAAGEDLARHYGLAVEGLVNCIIVKSIRASKDTFAACLVQVGWRVDLNGVVRKHLNGSKLSVADKDLVLKETGMEYGSITPIGLPKSWRVLIHPELLQESWLVVGSGKVGSKIRLSPETLMAITNAEIVKGMSAPGSS